METVAGTEHPNRVLAIGFLETAASEEIGPCTSAEILTETLFRYTVRCGADLCAWETRAHCGLFSQVRSCHYR